MRAPVVAVGDGALGFSSAPRDVFPETKERCSFQWAAHILDALPTSIPPLATRMLAHVRDAEERDHALAAAAAFDADPSTWPTAADTLSSDLDHLSPSPTFPPPTRCTSRPRS